MAMTANIQKECSLVASQILDTVRKSTDIFANDTEKKEATTFLQIRLQDELSKLKISSGIPKVVESLKLCQRPENKIYLAHFAKCFYEKQKSEMSLEEYANWKNGETVERVGTKVLSWRVGDMYDDLFFPVFNALTSFQNVWRCGVGLGVLSLYYIKCGWSGTMSVKAALKWTIEESVTYLIATSSGIGAVRLAGRLCKPLDWKKYVFVGASAGGLVALVAKPMIENYTNKLLDLPPDEEVEKAYHLFGLNQSATEEEINYAYRKISRENHPETMTRMEVPPTEAQIKKSVNLFMKVQKAIVLIRAYRDDEVYNSTERKSRHWKDFFIAFLRFRWKFMSDDESEAIAFGNGIPSLEVFEEEGPDTKNTLKATPAMEEIKRMWLSLFNSNIGKFGRNPFFGIDSCN